jgi:hypothetical protein
MQRIPFFRNKMMRYDFWITLFVMIVILLIVVIIKCIPKHKLPYCLGGTRGQEKFVCFKEYAKWCNLNGIPQVLNQRELSDRDKEWAIAETCKRLNIDSKLLKGL